MANTRSKKAKATKLVELNEEDLKEFYKLRAAKAKATRELNKKTQSDMVPAAETSGEFVSILNVSFNSNYGLEFVHGQRVAHQQEVPRRVAKQVASEAKGTFNIP